MAGLRRQVKEKYTISEKIGGHRHQENLLIRILLFYGLMFVYTNMRLSKYTENHIIMKYSQLFFIVDIITFLVFSIYLVKTFRIPVLKIHFSRKTLAILVTGLLAVFLTQNLFSWLSQYFPTDTNTIRLDDFAEKFPLAAFFFSCIMAPVVEEVICRAVFFKLFFQNFTRWRPFLLILLSGLIFGSYHLLSGGFSWQNLLVYSTAGWILGTVYYFSKDIRVSILIHFANNMTWQFAPFIFYLLGKFLM